MHIIVPFIVFKCNFKNLKHKTKIKLKHKSNQRTTTPIKTKITLPWLRRNNLCGWLKLSLPLRIDSRPRKEEEEEEARRLRRNRCWTL